MSAENQIIMLDGLDKYRTIKIAQLNKTTSI